MSFAAWKDGLYRVECGTFCAGFVLAKGRIVKIAPCLRRFIGNFARFAVWICP